MQKDCTALAGQMKRSVGECTSERAHNLVLFCVDGTLPPAVPTPSLSVQVISPELATMDQ